MLFRKAERIINSMNINTVCNEVYKHLIAHSIGYLLEPNWYSIYVLSEFILNSVKTECFQNIYHSEKLKHHSINRNPMLICQALSKYERRSLMLLQRMH